MPAIQDKERGTWIAQFYFTDVDGTRKRKRKRGFKLKREALAFERDFLANHTDDVNIGFEKFARLYLDDIRYRIKESSYEQKKFLIEKKVIPFFKNKKLSDIKPKDIRNWQNDLLSYKNENGEGYSSSYLKSIYNQLNSIFNFGVRFYDLKENPCTKAGSFGNFKTKEKQIWTLSDYYDFQKTLGDANPPHSLAIEVLFFTGMRIGEFLALTPEDIDLNEGIITINKTYQKINGKEIISKPKTEKSNRTIMIPKTVTKHIKDFLNSRKDLIGEQDRIFSFTSAALSYTLKVYAEKANVPKIRLHDLRHSHASLLINLGCNANVIADRLGHEKIETTLGIYTHLYPKKREEISEKLELLMMED